MKQSPEAVFKDLKKKEFSPIYFLQGDEPYYIDAIARYIETHALAEHDRSFNQIILYGKDTDISTILSQARRFPMMAERQVVIVKEAQEVADLSHKSGQQLLEDYIKNPVPSTVLVFCYKYKNVKLNTTLGKALDKFAVLVESKKMYDDKLPDWIHRYIQKKGFKTDAKAVQMLADAIGNNLERLVNEIDKVLINFDTNTQEVVISADVVQKYVGISKEYNVFELQKAIATKDTLKTYQILQYFEANPKANPIIPTIALIFTFFSKLLLIHHTTDKTDRGLATLLKINPFFVKEYRVAAVNYPLPAVIRNIHFMRTADAHSKGIDNTTGSDAQILKDLIFRLMH